MYLSRFLPIQKPFSYLSIHVNDINPLLFVVSNSLLLLPSLPLSLSLFSLYLSISLCVSVHPSPLHLSIFKLHLILSVAAAGAVAVFPFIALKCLSNLFKRKLKAVVSLSLHLSLSLRGFFCPFS